MKVNVRGKNKYVPTLDVKERAEKKLQKMEKMQSLEKDIPVKKRSAKTKKRIHTLMPEIKKVYNNSIKEVKTSIINDIIRDAFIETPPASFKGKKLKVYFAHQSGTKPPRFDIEVNSKGLVHFSYYRYLENKIRANIDFSGTPIIIQFKNKGEREL
jgi:GTP-binding protein